MVSQIKGALDPREHLIPGKFAATAGCPIKRLDPSALGESATRIDGVLVDHYVVIDHVGIGEVVHHRTGMVRDESGRRCRRHPASQGVGKVVM